MDRNSAIAQLIRRAGRRRSLLTLSDRAAFSFALFLGGFVLLLLIGVQPLDWLWLGLLLLGSFAIGLFRSRKRAVSPYQTAQLLDHRLGLHDALSTAWHFAERAPPPQSLDAARVQRASAEAIARSADIRHALPFHPSRSHYACLAGAFLWLSVFAVRYGVIRSLDLSPPLVHAAAITDANAAARKGPRKLIARLREGAKQFGIPVDAWKSTPIDNQAAPDNVLDTVDEPNVDNSNATTSAASKTKAPAEEGKQAANSDGSSNGDSEQSDAGDAQSREAQATKSEASSARTNAGQQTPGPASQNAHNASLMDKMRDAMSNLLSSLKRGAPANSGQQPSGAQPSNSPSARQAKQNQNQSGAPSGSSQRTASDSESQTTAQASPSAQTAQSARGSSADKSANRPPPDGAQSGIGSQDGSKDPKLAEELAAMGKISEIIGKRSASVTGEIMVEVRSGKQQLKTPYSQRLGHHSESGGEINRDEVPLAYQEYVQQYFEQIRKLPLNPKPGQPQYSR